MGSLVLLDGYTLATFSIIVQKDNGEIGILAFFCYGCYYF